MRMKPSPPAPASFPGSSGRMTALWRCFFASEEPERRQSQTWHIDFDLTRGAFDRRIYRTEIETDQGVFPMQPQYFHRQAAAKGFACSSVMHGLYMIDSFKRFDGRVYAVLNNFPGRQNAWAALNDSMDRFTVLGDYFLPNEAKLSESAVNRLPGRHLACDFAAGEPRPQLHVRRESGRHPLGPARVSGLGPQRHNVQAHVRPLRRGVLSRLAGGHADQRGRPLGLQYRHLARRPPLGAQVPFRDRQIVPVPGVSANIRAPSISP